MKYRHAPRTARRRGFSLMEVLVLVVVVGIVGAGAGRALQTVARTPVSADETFQIETQLISRMEQIRATPFDSITVGSTPYTISTGDASVGGRVKSHQMTVLVALADADGNGTPETNFKQVTVSCAGQTITTMITR